MNETGDVGGRNVLKRHGARISLSEIGAFYDDSDCDTPEDLKKICNRANLWNSDTSRNTIRKK